jgi:hypothetical protein
MSAFGTKRTSPSAQLMSAFGGKADITATERNFNLRLPQKLRQLDDVRRDPPRLVFCEQLAADPIGFRYYCSPKEAAYLGVR